MPAAVQNVVARLRPYLITYVIAYAALLAALLGLAIAVSVVPGLRDAAHVVLPFDWHRAPHDPSRHSVGTALSLWFHNARLALAPLAAAAAVQQNRGRLRQAADVVLALVLAADVIPVAIELGTWRTRLLPYIPNAPVELLALVIGPVSWWLVTRRRIPVRSLWLIATIVVALLAVAACLETWAVP